MWEGTDCPRHGARALTPRPGVVKLWVYRDHILFLTSQMSAQPQYIYYDTVFERFMNRILVDEIVGCWIWMGSTSGGYGQFFFEGVLQKAHRVAFQLFGEKLEEGKDLHHNCEVKLCVNPAHVSQLTRSEHKLWHSSQGV